MKLFKTFRSIDVKTLHKNTYGLLSKEVVGDIEDFCVMVFSYPQAFSDESKKYFGGDSGLKASWDRFRKEQSKPLSVNAIIPPGTCADLSLYGPATGHRLSQSEFVFGLLNMMLMESVTHLPAVFDICNQLGLI